MVASKVIDRLLTTASSAHTGREILQGLHDVQPLPAEEAEVFLGSRRAGNRAVEAWDPE